MIIVVQIYNNQITQAVEVGDQEDAKQLALEMCMEAIEDLGKCAADHKTEMELQEAFSKSGGYTFRTDQMTSDCTTQII